MSDTLELIEFDLSTLDEPSCEIPLNECSSKATHFFRHHQCVVLLCTDHAKKSWAHFLAGLNVFGNEMKIGCKSCGRENMTFDEIEITPL